MGPGLSAERPVSRCRMAVFLVDNQKRFKKKITMKSTEQAVRIYERCVEAAKKKGTLSYRDVLDHLGYGSRVQGHAIRYGLEIVWIACADAGLPLLTSIVISKSTGEPNLDGFSVKNWKEEAERVFNHESWPRPNEIPWEYVWNNRVTLSDKYGTSGYWS